MVQDCTGGCEAISDVLVSERADEHFVDSGKKNFLKSLVCVVVLIESCGGGVESIAKFSDLGASGIGWDDGYRAGVDGHTKGVIDKLLLTAGDIVSWRRPRVPEPRLD